MNYAGFEVDYNKCTGCGKCVKVCPGGVLFINEMKKAEIRGFSEFGWNGCWRCEHCLAVCPEGAVSVLGHKPENSTAPVESEKAEAVINSLIANRHSCRRYKDRNVEKAVIDDMISRLANAPNGGNKQQVEFTLIDDKEQTQIFRSTVYKEMERLAAEGIYPRGFDKESYEDIKRWRETVRPDMVLCGAPHILIPHVPLGQGEPIRDAVVVSTYFEILCASRGLGSVMMTFPLDILENMPHIKAMLKIPESHYIGMIIGFGYPEIEYARGVQKSVDSSRIHRLEF